VTLKVLLPTRLAVLAPLIIQLVSCQESSDANQTSADDGPSDPRAVPEAPAVAPDATVPSSVGADTLALTIDVDDPTCVPGECVCHGSTERSTGLWRVGLETAELTAGVHCIAADFDGNGDRDLAMLGGEGHVGVIMYEGSAPSALHELDAGGFPQLYQPRQMEGPEGEPVAKRHGIFVPNVGQNHAVFLWSGEAFVKMLYPAS